LLVVVAVEKVVMVALDMVVAEEVQVVIEKVKHRLIVIQPLVLQLVGDFQ
jgi:hypothetical protein